MKARLIPLLAVLTAGCGGPTPAPTPNGNTSAASPGRDYVAAVMKLSDKQRRGVFLRAINDAGLTCPAVESDVRLTAPNNAARWRAHCSDDTDHLVDIAPDGNAVVTSRRDE